MTIAIFGATGKLGSDVLDHLLDCGAEASDVLALGRNSDRLAELADRGFRTAQVDLDQPEGIAGALKGVDKVPLISTGTPGQRLPQHQAAVDAVKAAGVQHLVYTSALQAPTTGLVLADEHKATEEYITASGVPATFLRNGWYTENHQADFAAARRGVIANSAGAGRIASAPRREFGEAAAVVLTTPGHEGAGLRTLRRRRLGLHRVRRGRSGGARHPGQLPGPHHRRGAGAAARLRSGRGNRQLHRPAQRQHR